MFARPTRTLAGVVAIGAIASADSVATLTYDAPAVEPLRTTASNVTVPDAPTAKVPIRTLSRWPASVADAAKLTPLSATVCGSGTIPAGQSSTKSTLVAGD